MKTTDQDAICLPLRPNTVHTYIPQ